LAAALVVAALDSLITVTAIGVRWRRGCPSVPGWLGPVTAVATAAGITLQALSLPVAALASSAFWMQPYAVFSCVVITACGRPRPIISWVGVITVSYALSVLVALQSAGSALSAGQLAAVWANALAFPGFTAVAALLMWFLRENARLVAELRARAAASRAAAERITVRSRGHRAAHDVGKAFLRELLAGRLEPAALASWAADSRRHLLAALVSDPRRGVELRQEIAAIAMEFKKMNPLLRADLTGLTRPTSQVPMVFAESVREALNNASYHAPGSRVLVTAHTSNTGVEVCVRDEGPGCNPGLVSARWQAKQGTFARLTEAGGSWTVHSAGPGTAVTLGYPLTPEP